MAENETQEAANNLNEHEAPSYEESSHVELEGGTKTQMQINSNFNKIEKKFKKTDLGRNFIDALVKMNSKEFKIAFLINKYLIVTAILLLLLCEKTISFFTNFIQYLTLGILITELIAVAVAHFRLSLFSINLSFIFSASKEIILLIYLFTRGLGKVFCLVGFQFLLLLCLIDLSYFLILKVSFKDNRLNKPVAVPEDAVAPIKIEV